MSIDLVTQLLCAALLGLAVVLSWIFAGAARPYARRNLRFAALLYAGLAVADILSSLSHSTDLMLAVGLLVSTLAPPLLTIAAIGTVSRPPVPIWAALALGVSALAAIAVALTGLAVLALIPQIVALCILFTVSLRAPRGIALRLCLSVLALGAGALTIVANTTQAGAVLSLFSAAGLFGVTRALAAPLNAAVE